METIAISSFKTHALKLNNKLQKTHESFIITKRGKPVGSERKFRLIGINSDT